MHKFALNILIVDSDFNWNPKQENDRLVIFSERIETLNFLHKQLRNDLKLKQDQIAGKVAWEASAVDQMKGSWKDELILICLLGPAVLVFFPGMTHHIEAGFIALQQLPDYYKHLLYIACSASFGIKAGKGAMGLLKKK